MSRGIKINFFDPPPQAPENSVRPKISDLHAITLSTYGRLICSCGWKSGVSSATECDSTRIERILHLLEQVRV